MLDKLENGVSDISSFRFVHIGASLLIGERQKFTKILAKFWKILGPVLAHFWGFWHFRPSRLDSHDDFASIGLVYVVYSYIWTQNVTILVFYFDRHFLANNFFVLTPGNQGYPPCHGQILADVCLKNTIPGWGTTSWYLSMPHKMAP